MSEPPLEREPVDAPRGVVDTLVLPGWQSRTTAAGWARRIATFAIWATLHALFILLPPLVGVVYNLALAAAFVWWFAGRPGIDDARRATYALRPIGAAGRWLPLIGTLLAVFVASSIVIAARLFEQPARIPMLEEYLRKPFGWLGVLTAVTLVAPLLEEFLFRGWLQHSLERRMGGLRAVLVTAFVFTLAHGTEAFGALPRLAFALVAGVLVWRTRSIWPAVLLHGTYNGSIILLSAALPGVTEREISAAAHDPARFIAAVVVLAASGAVLAWSTVRAAAADGAALPSSRA